jgi:hypothetical protein
LGALDGLARNSGGDLVGVVFGLCLERQETAEFLLDRCAFWACLLEQRQNLIVIVGSCALAEPRAAYGVGGVDASVDCQAGCGDVPAGSEL